MSQLANLVVAAGMVATATVVLRRRLRDAPWWRACLTPLASIIGSGFLVLAPILMREFGRAAPLVMLALCIVAYGFGAVMRYNIAHFESQPCPPRIVRGFESLSSWALCFAYVISVCYYLKLFGAFAMALTPWPGEASGRVVSTAVLITIGAVGWRGGLRRLEHLETIAVSFKLIVIGGLLCGLALHAGQTVPKTGLVSDAAHFDRWSQLALAFGLIITVQGFETSRYLGAAYDAPTRIRTMRYAQWISTLIYVAYVGFAAASIPAANLGHSETAVIDMSAVVSNWLPSLLVAAALAAQFSAAVADALGCGGLAEEISGRRLQDRMVYVLIAAAGIALTWAVDVFGIIAWASRAFALYYALQSGLAARLAWNAGTTGERWRSVGFCALGSLGALIVLSGQPAE
ncbi:hypothetical protein [Solimonas terrae]|uniref:APC family permease n=1 Tax=Solimonas terrae TaxID=1396819 RepID=A0A6M2BNF9_9GAMM|nr:hypothetical protein [Solimonas terrae]NGY03587.1 hypothetical protein [Solimonas terrae]